MEEDVKLKDFTMEVEKFIARHKDVSPMDAILHLAEQYELDMEAVGKLVNGPLREKVLVEAKERNMMKDNTLATRII